MVSSNHCVGPLSRINIFYFLLSICTDEIISSPKTIEILITLPSGNEDSEGKLDPIS